ncbi:MAG: hypothetical protein CMB73_03055 [Euryarchaeota archaeon]|mgnify:CR=1 FL=1|nr:hypothetical protein [Euryarchaeota archaeon]|tara:strand:- start:22734 stop:24596 length:1863 start_codon:yes stop_codon:yes gene_type:complete
MAVTVSKERLTVTDLDFDQIKTNLKTFLQAQPDLADYDFEGSALSTIIDVLAYNTFYNSFNANVNMNEIFLDTSQIRNNVVAHAKSLGYVPRSATSPFASINVTINNPAGAPSSLSMSRGTTFQTTIDGTNYTFLNLEAQTIQPVGGVYTFSNLKVNQGTLRTQSYVVDDTSTAQKYAIPDTNVDTATLVVKVKTNSTSSDFDVYTLVTNIVDVKGDTQAYFLQEGIDGQFEIYFGDDVFGKKLDAGNVVEIEYLVTEGVAANNATVFKMTGNVSGNTNASVTLVDKSGGGADREEIDSIKFNAPLSFLSQNRVVTADDYKAIVKNNYTNTETISVWGGEEQAVPEYGKVFLSIKPANADTLTATQKQFIKDSILKTKNLVSITPEIVDPDYTFIKLEVFFKYDPNLTSLTAGELKNAVIATITSYNNTNLKKFDGVFRASQVTTQIDATNPAILNTIMRVNVQKRLYPTIGTAKKYELEFSSPFSTNIAENASVIDSSEFVLNGFNHKMQDIKTDDPNIRQVQFYRITNNQKIITTENAGTVDIAAGKVTLTNFNPASITNGSSYITVTGTPSSNDLAPKRNQLLQIDLLQTTVTPQIDEIATGAVIAGIGYTTTANSS